MLPETNPYEALATVDTDEPVGEIRRPAFGTFLIVVWTFEAVFKTYLVGTSFSHEFTPLQYLADHYHTWNRMGFLLVSSFFIIETIGPWIGIYYLTGRRAHTIPFDKALLRTLKLAGGIAVVASLVLLVYLELAAPKP